MSKQVPDICIVDFSIFIDIGPGACRERVPGIAIRRRIAARCSKWSCSSWRLLLHAAGRRSHREQYSK